MTNNRFIKLLSSGMVLITLLTYSLAFADIHPALIGDGPLQKKDFYTKLAPESEHPSIVKSIVYKLKYHHYEKIKLDDDLSKIIFDTYLSDLDPSRLYFLQSDIDSFTPYRQKIDDHLKKADLDLAYTIFNQYQQRVIERMIFILSFIKNQAKKVNFSIEEYFETDREKAPWPKTIKEQDELWRKRLKNEMLNLVLSGKEKDDIISLLRKRYRSQLNRASQTNSEDAFRIYMNALTQVYDPHTQYFSPSASENFNIQMSLSLEGIGAVLQRENEFTKVLRLVPAGPADKAGDLQPGDRIVGVGQGAEDDIVDVIGWRLDEVVHLIRGPKGTVVYLRIIPADAADDQTTRVIKITRDKVKLEEQAAHKKVMTVTRKEKTFKIGVIDIPTFYLDFKAYHGGESDYKSTSRDVNRLIDALENEDIAGIIIDLRDNGGGALQEANSLTGHFIQKGPIVQVRESNGRVTRYFDRHSNIVYDGPLLVMMNRMSASASEIFSGAIQDYHRGLIVGTQSFGKGTVQSLLDLQQGQLKITHAKFYRISGKSTQYQGIIPDIQFPPIYNPDKIGESTLPYAMKCDTIDPATHSKYNLTPQIISKLYKKHEQRIQDNVEFEFFKANLKFQTEQQEKTRISLSEATRKKERDAVDQWKLSWENKKEKQKA
ncbi:MAG: carboxyl-terminal processing protease [Candidatus Magnetoglobus multicellularis str. Araruama]|uniref:Carboxyl-terminal processing protease n=1 Tax=Candidatus Magnetoglobus multicellularis str. Araruama TaxID=890399 RepID=A0A1V1P8S3_9BACT|nr:MAG: carboxyl-terminal processing protease [Candidatus Magnetoglobus multicellularis str. Araruama]